MAQELILTHTFNGPRFHDHGLDLEVLGELTVLREILVAIAKDLWKQTRPDKQRLKKNFEEEFELKFFKIEQGSAAVPVVCVQHGLFVMQPEVKDAADMVIEAFDLISKDKPLPDRFPKNVIPMFARYGQTLKDGESFSLTSAASKRFANYNQTVKAKLSSWVAKNHEAEIDIIAPIVMARVDKPQMGLKLDDGPEIDVAFTVDEEASILAALMNHKSTQVRIKGRGEFSDDGRLQKVVQVEFIEIATGEEEHTLKPGKRIWHVFDDIMSDLSEEALQKLPPDAAENLDKYLYGS
jgi:hypothetical protein